MVSRRWAAGGLVAMGAAAVLSACGSSPAGGAKRQAGPPSVVTAAVSTVQTKLGMVGYRELGSGPPLVLIMGYAGTMEIWDPRFVDALARRYTVVTFDNAGIGYTQALPSPLTIDAMARQTSALIEALGLRRPYVLGWSMGGMIAQALAVLHPSLVRRLVLCATLPGNGKATFPSAAASAALEDPAKSKGGVLGLLFPADHAVAAAVYTKQILEFPHFYLAPSVVTTAQLGALGSWLVGKEAAGKHIDRIAVPTLVADGLKDELVPTANDRELAHVIKSSSLALYPDSGHGFLFQYEGRFLLRLEAFLGD